MGRFFNDALSIIRTAEDACAAGHAVSDLTILTGARTGIRVIAASDWPLDRLLADSGAEAAYRVNQHGDAVRVEARSGRRTLHLESAYPSRAAHEILGSTAANQAGDGYSLKPSATRPSYRLLTA